MRFVDSNIFLRFFDDPVHPVARKWHNDCVALFEQVERGAEQIITLDVVIAEVFWTLTARSQGGRPKATVAADLLALISLGNVRLPNKRRVVGALELVVAHPKLSFPDALLAVSAIEIGIPLVSYDTDFDRVPDIVREQPGAANPRQ